MRKSMTATPPVGMREAVQAIGGICSRAQVYGRCGMRPPHYIVTLEAGSGQSTLTEYLARAFADAGVRRFGGLDLFLEYRLDGTMEQLRSVFADIRACAVYTNDYEGVVAMDISGLEPHVNEGQAEFFLREIEKAARHATFIFFVPRTMSRNMAGLTDKLTGVLEESRMLELTPYTAEEIAQITMRMIGEAGVDTRDEEQILAQITEAAEADGELSVKWAKQMCRDLVGEAEFSEFVPVLTPQGAARACRAQARRA